MIELYKIIKGIYDPTFFPHFDFVHLSNDFIRTTGNKYKLIQHHCCYDLRKFNFTNRVISIRNTLSSKHHLDTYQFDQDVKYNYEADFHGQETVSGSGISWAICKSAPCSRQTTTPATHHSVFLQAGCPFCRLTSSIKALKAWLTIYFIYSKLFMGYRGQ